MSPDDTNNQQTVDQTLYAFDLCKAYPLPAGRMLVRNPRNGRHAVLTPDVFAALSSCRQFFSLSEHAARLAAENPVLEGQEDAVRAVLESVRDDGLLISADIYTVTLQPAAVPRFHVDKPVVSVITWERPEALARCLESISDNCDLKQIARLYVIDDSRDNNNQAQNRRATAQFALDAETEVVYMGAAEQSQFLEAIISRVPSLEEQVRFLIDRERWADYWTSGLARTVALLLSVGQRLLVLDDDIICEVHEPGRGENISFADNPRETGFYKDADEWSDLRASHGTDPFIRHMRCLGSELSDALGALGASSLTVENFKGARLDVLERLNGQSPVLITECGSLGDAGTSKLNWLATLRGESLKRLLDSEDTVDLALSKRRYWQGRNGAQISPRSNMSQLTGLDNRGLLPPYIPIMRGEDRLFGDMVEFVFPQSVVVDNAFALPHLPIPEREWETSAQKFDTRQPFPAFAMNRVEENQDSSSAHEPMPRLAALARLFEELSGLTHEQVSAEYQDKRVLAKSRQYAVLKEAQAAAEAIEIDVPERWSNFLQEGLDRLNRELLDNPVDAAIKGYPDHLEGEALTQWWKQFWRTFGQAIRAWPSIRQAARQVRPVVQ